MIRRNIRDKIVGFMQPLRVLFWFLPGVLVVVVVVLGDVVVVDAVEAATKW